MPARGGALFFPRVHLAASGSRLKMMVEALGWPHLALFIRLASPEDLALAVEALLTLLVAGRLLGNLDRKD